MSAADIGAYLEALAEPKRATLAELREILRQLLPDAEETISYGVPAFRLKGKVVAGFAAFKNHLSYLPHSGSVFPALSDGLVGYTTSSGALRFPVNRPLPRPLVERLVEVRLRQAFPARGPVGPGPCEPSHPGRRAHRTGSATLSRNHRSSSLGSKRTSRPHLR